MSEIQLTPTLVSAVGNTLVEHDAEARESIIAAQYLTAIAGYILAHRDMPSEQKREVVEQLGAFMRHVLDQTEETLQPPSQPPAQEAFGIWRPGDA